jgi:hypothetical protein
LLNKTKTRNSSKKDDVLFGSSVHVILYYLIGSARLNVVRTAITHIERFIYIVYSCVYSGRMLNACVWDFVQPLQCKAQEMTALSVDLVLEVETTYQLYRPNG